MERCPILSLSLYLRENLTHCAWWLALKAPTPIPRHRHGNGPAIRRSDGTGDRSGVSPRRGQGGAGWAEVSIPDLDRSPPTTLGHLVHRPAGPDVLRTIVWNLSRRCYHLSPGSKGLPTLPKPPGGAMRNLSRACHPCDLLSA